MAHARSLQRICKNLEKLKSTKVSKVEDIHIKLDQLNEEWAEYKDLNTIIPDDDITKKLKDDIEETYFSLKMSIRKSLANYQGASDTSANISINDLVNNQQSFLAEFQNIGRTCESDVKLPRVNVPFFSGNYDEFPSFQDLFEASINNNKKLSKVHKLQYLKGLLKGEAANLVRHITITEANYDETWKMIKARYDRKGQVVSNLVRRFIDQPSISQPNAKNLHHLVDVSTEILHGLKVLGPQAESRDVWLVNILVGKLDQKTRHAWALASIDDDFPSFQTLIDFLSKRSSAIEDCEPVKKSSYSKPRSLQGMLTSTIQMKCLNCKEQHALYQCEKFIKLPVEEKRLMISKKKLCFNCLRPNHMTSNCKSFHSCFKCKRRHHTLLHQDMNSSIDSNNVQTEASDNTPAQNTLALNTNWMDGNIYESILPTALVYVDDVNGKRQLCRLLLDSGAQASFVSESCIQRLQLERKNARICVSGISNGVMVTRGSTNLKISSLNYDKTVSINALILNKLHCKTPETKINKNDKSKLRNLTLADPYFYKQTDIDIIVGVDKFFHVMLEGRIENVIGSLIAQNTIFGWVVAGENNKNNKSLIHSNNILIVEQNQNLDNLLTKFWELEEILKPPIISLENEKCEKFFKDTTLKLNGRFQVRLPFKSQCNNLGNSFYIAKKRFISLEQRISRSKELKKQYSDVIKEYLALGHLIKVKNESIEEGCYLPHREVLKESETTSIRVVFDGSSKTSNGTSLNDLLMVGPTIQPPLWNILIRFRLYRYVFCSDVEKMYRQVDLHPEDQVYQKILWNDDHTNELNTYQLTTVTFGLACSAYLAIRCLQQCAHQYKEKYPEASNRILNDFYVDDLLTGADTIENALTLKNQIIEILQYGKFHLRKWKSNTKQLTNDIEKSNNSIFDDSTHKLLGLQWNPQRDTFIFQINPIEDSQTTKRSLISCASKIFDPMGWISPATILIKILFQKLWLIKLNWDDPVPQSIETIWGRIKHQLPQLSKIEIPRYIETSKNIQIHGFCDASERAYSAVVYIRALNESNQILVNIVTAKTRVAPIKQVSLPRLELCGAVLLSKLIKAVTTVHEKVDKIFAWTDSTIVLHWLSDHPSKWKSFIGNRTSEILTLYPSQHWRHVKSKDNPADCATRGMFPSELIDLKLWWNGPSWLSEYEENWPVQPELIDAPEHIREERKNSLNIYKIQNETNPTLEYLINISNSYNVLLRVLGFVLRFISKSRRICSEQKYLTLKEFNQAEEILIKWVQQMEYGEELSNLKRDKQLKSTNKLLNLSPFIDENGMLRVGGRIRNASIAYSMKFPIILPRDHHLTKIIINHWHRKYFHSGPSLTSHLIRQKFWIVQGRSVIRNEIRKCVVCLKSKAKLSKQLMGDLPQSRLTPSRPFSNTGIDYAGPITLATRKGRGAKHVKAYIAVFVCLITKAVHLELTSDLSTDAFIATLRRFVSRRGLPKNIYSDNGSNFVGANRKINEMAKFLQNTINQHDIAAYLIDNSIEWHFIPPSAPNFGGLWEAAVKSMKGLLLKCTHNSFLNYEEMTTFLAEVEAILNSRPLYAASEDDSSFEALSPGHFLIGAPLISAPDDTEEEKISYGNRWQQIQNRTRSFWKRFSIEYFNQMQQKNKWYFKQKDLQIGDLVLIKEENLPSCKWPMGRIIELHPGADKLVRVVSIKTANKSIIKRPINKLSIIPIN